MVSIIKEDFQKEIGVDLDGTLRILPGEKIYARILNFLPDWLTGIFTLFTGIVNEGVKKILEELKREGWNILILSSRMRFFWKKSVKWLQKNQIPYDQLICLGPIFRKAKKCRVLKKRGINILVDDDILMRFYLKERSIIPVSPRKFVKLFKTVVLR